VTDLFERQDCIDCFINFMVPKGFTDKRRSDKRTFYCPNGHPMSYTLSEADKLRQERDRLAQRIAQKDDEIRSAWATATDQRERREAAERRASAARGQVTKLKRRASAGVCPCCNRTFAQLARHMAAKHKGFTAEEVVPPEATVQ
jgi:hypothetical protein